MTHPRHACPEHGPLPPSGYDTHHRCLRCGRAVTALGRPEVDAEAITLPRRDLEVLMECTGCAYTHGALKRLLEMRHDDL